VNQLSFSDIEYSLRKRTTRREEFLKKWTMEFTKKAFVIKK